MIRIESRNAAPLATALVIPIVSALIALGLSTIPLLTAGANPITAYIEMWRGVFGSGFAVSNMLTRATPLIFTGLAAALAFRAKLWNIGAEGELYLGAMAAVAIGSGVLDQPGLALIPIIVLIGAAAGSMGMVVPTYLKSRFGADEVVTTLLLNFVILTLVQMMLEGPLQDPVGLGWPQSAPILDQGMLPTLVDRMRLHSGFIIALILAVLAQIMLLRSVWVSNCAQLVKTPPLPPMQESMCAAPSLASRLSRVAWQGLPGQAKLLASKDI